MHFSNAVIAAASLAGFSLAAEHTIRVGGENGDLVFVPDNVEAAEGDSVIFKFWPKNHSVAQAAFDSPCTPLEGGFWSGYWATTDEEKAADTSFVFNVTNATQPIWFYCTQGQHCQNGMVGGINVRTNGTGRTLEAFREASADADENVTPTSTAGEGGELVQGNNTSPTDDAAGPEDTSAANLHAASSGLAFTGVLGTLAFLFL